MATLVLPHSINDGDPRDAEPIQENFEEIQEWANGGIGNENLAAASVDTPQLAALAVETGNVGNNAITPNKMSASIVSGYKEVPEDNDGDAYVELTVAANTFTKIDELSTMTYSNSGQNLMVMFNGHVTIATPTEGPEQAWVAIKDIESGKYITDNAQVLSGNNKQETIPISGFSTITAGSVYNYDVMVKLATAATIKIYGEGGRSKVCSIALPYEEV